MKIFYIIGSFRSGTTLLRLCLDSHPKILVIDEIGARDFLRPDAPQKIEDLTPPGIEAIGFKVPRHTERIASVNEAQSVDEKPVYFALIRNPLSVVASMKKLARGDERRLLDGGFCFPQSEALGVESDEALADAFAAYKPFQKKPSVEGAARAALLWRRKTQGIESLYDSGANVKIITYQGLVESPEVALKAAVKALGLPWDESVLSHHEVEHAECNINEQGLCIGLTDPRRPIDQDSTGLWKQVLTEAEIEAVRAVDNGTYSRVAGRSV